MLPVEARLLFIGLWGLADREGRLEDRPARIKAELFAYDPFSVQDVDCWLQALADADEAFIFRYSFAQCRYIQVKNFNKHQAPHIKEQKSRIPAPNMPGVCPVQAPDEQPPNSALAPPDSLNPDSLNPSTKPCASDDARPVGSLPSIDDPPFENLLGVPLADLESKPDRKTKLTPEQARWFSEFWAHYWRRDDKLKAQHAFSTAVTSVAMFATVVTAVRAQHPEMMSRPAGKRPQGSTWLKGERWNDETGCSEDQLSTYPPVPKYETRSDRQSAIDAQWERYAK
jgi:hypothetical protein